MQIQLVYYFQLSVSIKILDFINLTVLRMLLFHDTIKFIYCCSFTLENKNEVGTYNRLF